MKSLHCYLLGVILIGLSASVVPAQSQTLPPVRLRGYGVVSGVISAHTQNGSLLRVDTESVQKARLLQAKFLSDFRVLPGVQNAEMTVGAARVAVQQARDQGTVAALRSGRKVWLAAATDQTQLAALLKTLPAEALTASRAVAAVPMYLDRWDKFSFRHYYWPWQIPKDATESSYGFTHDFDYAQAQDRAGILVPIGPLATDSAEGMLNNGWVDWVADEAAKRRLPVDVHLGTNAGTEPVWFLNQYRAQTQMKMPGFTGNFHDLMSPYLGGQGVLSWSATTGEDARLGLLQTAVRRYAAQPNTVSFLEPHGELKHGDQDIFLEYGPVADAGFQRYLRETYGTFGTVARRWERPLTTWSDVRLPEIVSFAGWNAQALGIDGPWRMGYEELTEPAKTAYDYDRIGTPKSIQAPDAWYQPDFDDTRWPEDPGAGNDKQLFLVKRPAVFRRRFEVGADWKAANPRVWLYLWDMNLATGQQVRVVLNGQEVGRSKIAFVTPHWSAMDVSAALRAGPNTLAVRLPQGCLSYKTYLSPVAPKQYPNLGAGLNAQWVDFIDFTGWSRIQAVRRGMEMIRQAAPAHPITLMAPDAYADGIKSLAERYGGEFHDTGYMAAFWADGLPALMRGADLPFSLEPGGPASTLAEWKRFWGLWQTEGVQSVDYFIHLGDILWHPDIKADYEAHRRQISLLGQSHTPKAETALFFSDRVAQLTGYPWGAAPNTNLGGGYWNWNAGSVLRGRFPYDALSQSSFASGDAKAYRVIIDSNTSIMDEAMVSAIEKWVRGGGTFITLAQTGRHTPEQPDAWPIARLTGYKVTHIDQLNSDGGVAEHGTLELAPGQSVYDAAWNGVPANGLHLQKTAPEAQNLLLWKDGTVAAGARPLGQGWIVQLGAKFTGTKIMDRVDPGSDNVETQHLRGLLTALLRWRHVQPEAGRLREPSEWVLLRPAVTNNGLYDTWTVWNQSPDTSQTVSVLLARGKTPSFALDARDNQSFPVTLSPEGASLENIVLQPLETRVFLTPRDRIAQAPLAWFDLQRHWWRGATPPNAKPLPGPSHRFSRDLTYGWKFRTLSTAADAAPMLAAGFDDRTWASRSIGIWDVKDADGVGHGVFRRHFTVPAEWTDGRVSVWLTSWFSTSFVDAGRVWLDGREVKPLNNDSYIAQGLPSLAPGTSHTLAVAVQSAGVLAGLRGQCWLSFEPDAPNAIDLAGPWTPSGDGLHDDAPITLPGPFSTQFLKRTVFVDAKYRGQNAVMTVDGSRELVSVIINGHLVRRHHHMIGHRWSLNLTPFIHFGAANEIELARWDRAGPGTVQQVSLGFFDRKFYP